MRYALDDLMNPKTYMETRFGLVRYTGVLEANECADLTMAGGKLAAGMSKLAGHKEFAVSSDLSLLGRTVDIYMLNGEAVGSPVASAGEIYYTFADAQELKAVCDSNSFTFADNCSYYSNFRTGHGGHPVQPAGKRKDHGHRPYRRPQVRRRAGHVRPHRDRRQHRSADHQSRHERTSR